MSRYEIRGREPHTAIVVGWDPPLATFFAQVWDELAERVAPFVTLTPELREQLARGRTREPGRLTALRK